MDLIFRRLANLFRGKQQRFKFYSTGFHGDANLIKLVDYFLANKVDYFIETGSNVGSTLVFVAKRYPRVKCLSCEPDFEAYSRAKRNARGLKNVQIFNCSSQEFLKYLRNVDERIFLKHNLFWLDAHGYGFEWPIKFEINYIMSSFVSGYILVDDFQVPGNNSFLFDSYDGQVCSFEYIKESIPPSVQYSLYYPNYKERTSKHHPLRGWGLFALNSPISFPSELNAIVHQLA